MLPITGVGAAKAATLTFIVGGSADGFERAKPLLEKMGKNVIHCGAIGSGQVCMTYSSAVVLLLGYVSDKLAYFMDLHSSV